MIQKILRRRNNSFVLVALVGMTILLCISFKEKNDSTWYNTDWLIVKVDTAGVGYFAVNNKNRVLLRMDKTWHGGDFYALNGNSECMKIQKIKNRMKGNCWLRSRCGSLVRVDSSHYNIGMIATDRDALYFRNFLGSLEYDRFMRHFLEESSGEVTLINDTLTFDMQVLRRGREIPFRVKCVRDTVN